VLGRTIEEDEYTSAPTITAPSNTFTGHWTLTGGSTTATHFGFDQRGTQSTVTDATGNTWTSTYDVLGRVVAKSDPDAGDSTMSYDQLDRLRDYMARSAETTLVELSRWISMHHGQTR
jgi:YD repeat-containing protein